MTGRLALVLVAIAALATPASAALVPRAEQGSVPFVVGAPEGLAAPVVVRAGDVAWRETYRPFMNVRLLDEVPARKRPSTKAVAAGTVLYGYRLSGGYAFCPPTNYRAGVREVQCLRDFNDDGRFDGVYVTDARNMKSRTIAAFLHELTSTRLQRYEAIDVAQAAPIPAAVIFKGVSKGQATFVIRVEDDQLDSTHGCLLGADSCDLWGLSLKVTSEGEGVRIELLGADSERGVEVILTGGPV
ncbi:MAG: hypothetical protein Q7T61_10610 [Caulobacter sp.]|nr:hypothetical protein [Caulobacter sp.]